MVVGLGEGEVQSRKVHDSGRPAEVACGNKPAHFA